MDDKSNNNEELEEVGQESEESKDEVVEEVENGVVVLEELGVIGEQAAVLDPEESEEQQERGQEPDRQPGQTVGDRNQMRTAGP